MHHRIQDLSIQKRSKHGKRQVCDDSEWDPVADVSDPGPIQAHKVLHSQDSSGDSKPEAYQISHTHTHTHIHAHTHTQIHDIYI